MPARRSSAATAAIHGISHSSSRVHKSSDSGLFGQGSVLSSGLNASATPLQKIVKVLVERLKNKVRYHDFIVGFSFQCPAYSFLPTLEYP